VHPQCLRFGQAGQQLRADTGLEVVLDVVGFKIVTGRLTRSSMLLRNTSTKIPGRTTDRGPAASPVATGPPRRPAGRFPTDPSIAKYTLDRVSALAAETGYERTQLAVESRRRTRQAASRRAATRVED
jgi:hypothetical protein